MHTTLGKFIKYFLWVLLFSILFLLLVGLSKYNWNVSTYIQFLNNNNRNDAWRQGNVASIFRANVETGTVTIGENIELNTGALEATTGDVASGVLDVYDPTFEQDMNQIPQDSIASGDYVDEETGFGFVTPTTSGEVQPSDQGTPLSGDSKAQLLELMKKREMSK